MITRLKVGNYRSLADIDIRPGPLMVLVGANGSGKSNLIDVLRFVRDIMVRGLNRAVLDRHGIDEIRCRSSADENVRIHLRLDLPDCSGEYGFTLGRTDAGGCRVTWEKCVAKKGSVINAFEIRDGKWVTCPECFSPDHLRPLSDTELTLPAAAHTDSDGIRHICEYLGKMGFYAIHPENMRPPQKLGNPYPLDEDGRNIASVLRDLGKKPAEVANLLDALRVVVPDVENCTVEMIGGYLVTRLHHTPVNGETPAFDLAHESEGTLRILGILTAFYQTPPIPLLAVEEPELNIHPGVIGILRDLLFEMARGMQVIVTTHSPDLIADLPADILMIVEKDHGVTKIGAISGVQRRAVTEKLFWPGELMRMEGLRRESALAGRGLQPRPK